MHTKEPRARRYTLVSLVAGLLALAAAVSPLGQAEQARAFAPGNCGGFSTLTANCANLPLLVEAGIVSGAEGTAVATGGVATVATASTASGMGITGWSLAVGAGGAAITTAILGAGGLPDGIVVKTDPAYLQGSGCVVWSSQPSIGDDLPDAACAPFTVSYGTSAAGHAELVIGSAGVDVNGDLQFPYTRFGVFVPTVMRFFCYWTASASSTVITGWRQGTSFNGNGGPGETGGLGCFGSSPSSGTGSYRRGMALMVNLDGIVRYYWIASANGTPETVGEYHGTIRVTLTCASATGSRYVEQTGRIDAVAGDDLPVPAAVCAPDEIATFVAIDYQADGSTEWVGIGSASTPSQLAELPITYPDCFGPNVAGCQLQLLHQGGQGQWESCGGAAEYCPDWVQQWQAQPSLYRCQYGSTVLSIDYCSAFRRPDLGVLPNSNGDEDEEGHPVLLPPTAPAPIELPNPVLDPTGTPADLADVGPDAEDEAQECFPTGWGVLNPVSWVLMPTKCALRWAFVPPASDVALARARVEEAWAESGPGGAAQFFGTTEFAAVLGTATGGCSGVTVPTGWLNMGPLEGSATFPESFTMLAACPGDVFYPYAQFTTLVLGVGAVVIVFRTWPSLIGRIVGYTGVDG